MQAGEGFPDVEAERGVEREGAVVEGSLDQADSWGVLLEGAIHDGLHELAAYSEVLNGRVDGDGAYAADCGTLIESVAAYDSAFAFCYYGVKVGTGEHHREYADGDL